MSFPKNSGVVYKTSVDSMLALNDKKLQGEYATALLEYIIYGEYKEKGDNPVVDALMVQASFASDRAAAAYERAKEDGYTGGRKIKYSSQEVYDFVIT